MIGLWDRLRGKGQGDETAATVRQRNVTENSSAAKPVISGTAPGQLLGGVYPVVRLLGRGGFGEVFLCTQPAWNIEVAVKVPNSEALAQGDILRWLQREAEAWTNLGLHPHIAYCYHLHPIDDIPLLVVEYVPGGTLLDYLRRKDNPAANNARASVDLALQMCHALEHAHAHGVIHRDLKPENMLLTTDGLVKLTDFGIAQIGVIPTDGHNLQPDLAARRSLWGGTEGYAAPEQFDRSQQIDERADLFGLGVCLYELFCGRRPYSTTFGPRQEAPDPWQLRRDGKLPEGLGPLLQRMVSWNADGRPASAKAIRGELAKIYRRAYEEDSVHAELPPLEMTASGHNNRGVSYHFLGKSEAAEAAFVEALAVDPLHSEAAYNLGTFRWRRGEMTDLALLRQLEQIRSAGGGWRALHVLGLVHLERHDRQMASTLLAEAAKLAPEQTEVESALARATDNQSGESQIRTLFANVRVRAVAISPDAQRGLSGSEDGALRLWNLANGKCLRTFEGHTDSVRSVAFLSGSNSVLSGSLDKTLRLWNLDSGECLRTFEGHTEGVSSAAFSKFSRQILSGGIDGTLRLWDVESGKCLRSFEAPTYHLNLANLNPVALSPDGRLALSGGADKKLRLWEVATGKCLQILEGHGNWIHTVAFSPDWRMALSGSRDGTLRLWNLGSGECLRVLAGHIGYVNSVAFLPNGRTVVSGGRDNMLRLWDITSGKCLRSFEGHRNILNAVAVSDDGRTAVSGSDDHTLRLWALGGIWSDHASLLLAKPDGLADLLDVARRRASLIAEINDAMTMGRPAEALRIVAVIEALPGQQHNPEVGQIRRRLALQCRRGALRAAWTLREFSGHTDTVNSVTVSSDGNSALSGSDDKTVRLWDVESGKCRRIFTGHAGFVYSVALSTNGLLAVSGDGNGVLRLWDVKSGNCLRTFDGHKRCVNSVSFSPDGRMALSGSEDKTLRLWDVETGKCLRTFEGHTNGVKSAALSPDGQLALSGSWDSTLMRLWDLRSGECLRIFKGCAHSVAFSLDGRQALSASDNTLRLWDVASGYCLHTFEGHTEYVNMVAFSPDGRHAISGSADGTVKLWQIESRECLHTLIGDGHLIESFVLSPDATMLIATEGPHIRIWHLDWELLPPIANELSANAKTTAGKMIKIFQGENGEFSPHAAGLASFNQTASGHNNRGVSYHSLGKIEAAEAAFVEALAVDPLHSEATYNRGVLRWRRGQMTDIALLRRLDQIRLLGFDCKHPPSTAC